MTTTPQGEAVLLPCPFCGEAAEIDAQRYFLSLGDGRTRKSTAIYCQNCPADVELCHDDTPDLSADDRVEIVTRMWNTRAALAPPNAANEAEEVRDFNKWAFYDTTLPMAIGLMRGADAGRHAWLARARRAALGPPNAAPRDCDCPVYDGVALYHHPSCSSLAPPNAAIPSAEPIAWLLTGENINRLQIASVQRLIDRAKHAHHTDLIIRINGQDEHYEADWLKHLTRAAPPNVQSGDSKMRETLEKIAGFAPGNGDVCEVIARIAREALAIEYEREEREKKA